MYNLKGAVKEVFVDEHVDLGWILHPLLQDVVDPDADVEVETAVEGNEVLTCIGRWLLRVAF